MYIVPGDWRARVIYANNYIYIYIYRIFVDRWRRLDLTPQQRRVHPSKICHNCSAKTICDDTSTVLWPAVCVITYIISIVIRRTLQRPIVRNTRTRDARSIKDKSNCHSYKYLSFSKSTPVEHSMIVSNMAFVIRVSLKIIDFYF